MSTFAEKYRQERKPDYADVFEYLNWLQQFDPQSSIQATSLGAVIIFSDGSKHLMDRK